MDASAADTANLPRFCIPGTEQTRMGMSSTPPLTHWKSPMSMATRYVDNFGVVRKRMACLPGPAGVAGGKGPLEVGGWALLTTSGVSEGAFLSRSPRGGEGRG